MSRRFLESPKSKKELENRAKDVLRFRCRPTCSFLKDEPELDEPFQALMAGIRGDG
jgi:hypothetical protein